MQDRAEGEGPVGSPRGEDAAPAAAARAKEAPAPEVPAAEAPRAAANQAAAAMGEAAEFPQPHPEAGLIRILWVFAALEVGGAETEARLLACHLDRRRYRIEVLPCFRRDGMPERLHGQLRDLGVRVDTTALTLGFEDTVAYLRQRLSGAEIVISSQDVADIYPALEGMAVRPPLIERGRRVGEALAGPKHFTARYAGAGRTVRAAAAGRMADRPAHAVEIPAMVDPAEFDPAALARARPGMRAALRVAEGEILVGWVGRLDGGTGAADFIRAAGRIAAAATATAPPCGTSAGQTPCPAHAPAPVSGTAPAAASVTASAHASGPDPTSEQAGDPSPPGGAPSLRFIVVGGPDASGPAAELRALAAGLGLGDRLVFTGDRADIPTLLGAMDMLCRLSGGEGMSQTVAEAGAAGLPVIATPDDGARQQIGESGLFVPQEDPAALAAAILRLACDPALRARLGDGLRARVLGRCRAEVVVPQWARLLDAVLAEVRPAPPARSFASFLLGGWECSTHRLRNGRRLDLLAETGHDAHAGADYRQLAALGIRACRDGFRWHLIDSGAGRHDFSSILPMLRAARESGTQVIWDLLHYGWPDDLDIWSPAFVDRFAALAKAAGRLMREETDAVPFWCPVNEISFLAWAGGDARYLNPFAAGRGFELKVQLARAALAAMAELRAVDPRARFVMAEPLLGVHHDAATGRPWWEARGHHEAQFQAFDLISGRIWPQIGGAPVFLDLVGVNYYFNNQWIHAGPVVDMDHPAYRPLSDLLAEVAARYDRPLLIAETGTEGNRRGPWLDYVGAEVLRARRRGVAVEGICLYPVANHRGWDDDRICPNGLVGHEPRNDGRAVDPRLAEAAARLLSKVGSGQG